MKKLLPLLAGFLLIIFAMNCEKDQQLFTSLPWLGTQENLIQNPSFEINGMPTLDGWVVEDCVRVDFVQDTPPMGGQWAICIVADYSPYPPWIYYALPSLPGTHSYKLTVWAKHDGVVEGVVNLGIWHGDSLELKKRIIVRSTEWEQYMITDNLNTSVGDRIAVFLSGGFSHLLYGRTYFDECQLRMLDETSP